MTRLEEIKYKRQGEYGLGKITSYDIDWLIEQVEEWMETKKAISVLHNLFISSNAKRPSPPYTLKPPTPKPYETQRG